MKLYWCPRTRSLLALWMLEETGAPYEPILIDIRAGAQDGAARAAARGGDRGGRLTQ